MSIKINHLIACIHHPIQAIKYFNERIGGTIMNDRESKTL